MNDHRWTPHVTVATVVERVMNGQSQYLLVHEQPEGKPVYNQPAGHLDEGEGLIAAATRETLEETGWQVTISDYLGMYRYIAPNGVIYLRHGFAAKPLQYFPERQLDAAILKALWLDYEKILQLEPSLRSPMVKQLLGDYRNGICYPLAVLNEHR